MEEMAGRREEGTDERRRDRRMEKKEGGQMKGSARAR